ncbi:uncharacterized protein LOC113290669 [Papaver somniferum]|uniref:uncharacterized protein LOC113290669 n=1 Tax=Papaver somniferum TaxID=3469 RepID=UPI000E6FD90D|nr:uncharacterized protein LOC113290669 [Papaver somniferum]
MGEELNQDRSIKEYMYPTRESQPSCIILPADAGRFELKASTIHMLPVFRGVDAENPYHHVRDFEDICGTLRFNQMPEESLKLRLFPFSLKEKAKSWMYALEPQSVRTWDELTKEFFKKFFPNHKTATFRQSLNVESMCNGLFIDKSANEAWTFLIKVAEKTQQWESISEPKKTAPVDNVRRIESNFEEHAKVGSLDRRVEVLEMQKNVKTTAPTLRDQIEMATCAACHSSDHLVDSCPDLHEFQESRVEHANALYHKQENNPYSQTYNPGWRNHPNFSWSKGHIQKSAFQASTSTCDEPSHNQVNVVTTLRSGKVVENNVGVPQSKESNSDLQMHTTPQKTSSIEKESEQDSDSTNSTDVNVPISSSVPVAPFPQRLMQ